MQHQFLFHQRRLIGSSRIVRSFSWQHQREVAKKNFANHNFTTTTRIRTTSALSRAAASPAKASRRFLSSEQKVAIKAKPCPPNVKPGENILPLDFVTSPAVQFALPLLGHGAYIILGSGFLMTDMLYLRVVLAGGYMGLVVFHMMHLRPLRIPLRWSALFIFVNAGAACLLLADRYAPTFSVDDEELYVEHFQGALTRGQFYQLLQLGTRQEDVPDGEVLAVEGRACAKVYFIERGRAKIYHHKAFAATINQGGFVNDVAFQQGQNIGAYGTVVTSGNCSLIEWDQSKLRDHLTKRPEMDRNMKYLMSDHLVKSLLRQREAAHDRQLFWSPNGNEGLQKRQTADLKFGFRRSPSESKIAWDLRHEDDKDTGTLASVASKE
jgi:CRP-like cAMP-binding protein